LSLVDQLAARRVGGQGTTENSKLYSPDPFAMRPRNIGT